MTTRYEIVAHRTGFEPVHVCYTERRTKQCLIHNSKAAYHIMLAAYGNLAKLTETQLDMEWSYNQDTGMNYANGAFFVRFSGQTERG